MKIVHALFAAFLLLGTGLAQALDIQPYSQKALAQAQETGAPVALHFRADWCPTCRAQDKILKALRTDPELKLTVLSVDYDTETALKSRFAITRQSTLVVLRGQRETARVVADTTREGIRRALLSAL